MYRLIRPWKILWHLIKKNLKSIGWGKFKIFGDDINVLNLWVNVEAANVSFLRACWGQWTISLIQNLLIIFYCIRGIWCRVNSLEFQTNVINTISSVVTIVLRLLYKIFVIVFNFHFTNFIVIIIFSTTGSWVCYFFSNSWCFGIELFKESYQVNHELIYRKLLRRLSLHKNFPNIPLIVETKIVAIRYIQLTAPVIAINFTNVWMWLPDADAVILSWIWTTNVISVTK